MPQLQHKTGNKIVHKKILQYEQLNHTNELLRGHWPKNSNHISICYAPRWLYGGDQDKSAVQAYWRHCKLQKFRIYSLFTPATTSVGFGETF